MAPVKKIKTYERRNSSLVNNSVDAFNILFAKNMTKRLLGKKKKTLFVKELPRRRKYESLLADDSLHISTEDTFDKLKKPVNSSVQVPNNYMTCDTNTNSSHLTTNNLISSNSVNNSEKSQLTRLQQSSVDKVEESLEVEKIETKPNTSLSYITVPKSNLLSETPNLGVSTDNFIQKIQYQFPIFCSTPIAPFKHKKPINQTISPIKVHSLLKQTFQEIQKWDCEFPVSSGRTTRSRRLLNNTDPQQPSVFKNLTENSERIKEYFANLKTPKKEQSFITVRRGKVIKSYKKGNKTNTTKNLTVSLESFTNFETKTLHDSNIRGLKETFLSQLSLVNFVSSNKMKKSKNNSNLHSSQCKELIIKIPRLADTSKVFTSSESSFENFYSRNINTHLSNFTDLDQSSEDKKKQKSLIINLTNQNVSCKDFETFYSQHFENLKQNMKYQHINTISTPKKLSISNSDRWQVEETEGKHLKINLVNDFNAEIFEAFFASNLEAVKNKTDSSFNKSLSHIKDNKNMIYKENLHSELVNTISTPKKLSILNPDTEPLKETEGKHLKINLVNDFNAEIFESFFANNLEAVKDQQKNKKNSLTHIEEQEINNKIVEYKDLRINLTNDLSNLISKQDIFENLNDIVSKKNTEYKDLRINSKEDIFESFYKNNLSLAKEETYVSEESTENFNDNNVETYKFNKILNVHLIRNNYSKVKSPVVNDKHTVFYTRSHFSQVQLENIIVDVSHTEQFEMFYKNNYDDCNTSIFKNSIYQQNDTNDTDIIESSINEMSLRNGKIKQQTFKILGRNITSNEPNLNNIQNTVSNFNEIKVNKHQSIQNFNNTENVENKVNDKISKVYECKDNITDEVKVDTISDTDCNSMLGTSISSNVALPLETNLTENSTTNEEEPENFNSKTNDIDIISTNNKNTDSNWCYEMKTVQMLEKFETENVNNAENIDISTSNKFDQTDTHFMNKTKSKSIIKSNKPEANFIENSTTNENMDSYQLKTVRILENIETENINNSENVDISKSGKYNKTNTKFNDKITRSKSNDKSKNISTLSESNFKTNLIEFATDSDLNTKYKTRSKSINKFNISSKLCQLATDPDQINMDISKSAESKNNNIKHKTGSKRSNIYSTLSENNLVDLTKDPNCSYQINMDISKSDNSKNINTRSKNINRSNNVSKLPELNMTEAATINKNMESGCSYKELKKIETETVKTPAKISKSFKSNKIKTKFKVNKSIIDLTFSTKANNKKIPFKTKTSSSIIDLTFSTKANKKIPFKTKTSSSISNNLTTIRKRGRPKQLFPLNNMKSKVNLIKHITADENNDEILEMCKTTVSILPKNFGIINQSIINESDSKRQESPFSNIIKTRSKFKFQVDSKKSKRTKQTSFFKHVTAEETFDELDILEKSTPKIVQSKNVIDSDGSVLKPTSQMLVDNKADTIQQLDISSNNIQTKDNSNTKSTKNNVQDSNSIVLRSKIVPFQRLNTLEISTFSTNIKNPETPKSTLDLKHSNDTNREVTKIIDISSSSELDSSPVIDKKKLNREFKKSLDNINISVTAANQNIFKIPKVNRSPKSILLKAGKSWRRSLSMYKQNSLFLNFSKEDCVSPYLAKTCPKGKLSKLSTQRCSKRLSVRFIPVKPLQLLQNEQRITILEDYAINTSYVPDQIIEASLEDSFRCLSLNQHQRRSSVKDHPLGVTVTARDIVLRKCGQTEPIHFSKSFPDNVLQNCQKIGEGVYGEVFLLRNPNGGTSVLKIVPVEGDQIVNGERQKKFEEILSEIIITIELSNLRNNQRNGISTFAEVQKIQCVQGRYPEKLVDLWDLYDETRNSENDCPEMFGDNQLYIVFQMAYGGKDLESFIFNNAMQTYSLFQQVACALSVAEEELQFEHRDLHWGNILVSTVEANKMASFSLENKTYSFPTMGVEAVIIDYTLSRIEHDGVVIFNDLGLDPDLFTAEGDYQFEIYRLMQEKNRNNWKTFEPFSNLLWLHYVLDKAIVALRYRNIKTKRHKEYIRKLKMLKEDILSYQSVKDFVFAHFL